MPRPNQLAVGVLIVLGCLPAFVMSAERWQEQPAAQPPAEPERSRQVEPDDVEVYSYDPAGRRDPFVSLINRGTDLRPLAERPSGLAGLSINELLLRGIVFSRGRYLAVLEAPDSKTYIISGDERLFDGSVKSVSADGVVFLEEVNDPLSLVKEREVSRTLGGAEDRR